MIREVDFADYYLPVFMQNYKESVAALNAEQPEFMIMWKAVDRVFYNRFIATADEYGISRYEKMLGILPYEEDNLEARRMRVQARWFNALPYTMKSLLQKLISLCGGTDFTVTKDFSKGYTLDIMIGLKLSGQIEELESIINSMLPANIVMNISLKYTQHEIIASYTHRYLGRFTHYQLRNEVINDGE